MSSDTSTRGTNAYNISMLDTAIIVIICMQAIIMTALVILVIKLGVW